MSKPIRELRGNARIGLAVMLVGTILAGCTTTGTPLAFSGTPRGTVAFESIDGLPEGQFHKLVQSLSQEAEARQLAVVSHAEPAQYRVRGYAAASIHSKRTTITWVWDVYDAERQRAIRLAGEEQAAPGRRGWAAADDPMLQRIARDGIAQLASFLASPNAAPPPAAVPSDNGPAVAAATSVEPSPAPDASHGLRTSGLALHAALNDAAPR